jgi:hypothetical protein
MPVSPDKPGLFLVVLGFELRVLYLLGSQAALPLEPFPPALFAVIVLGDRVSLFARDGWTAFLFYASHHCGITGAWPHLFFPLRWGLANFSPLSWPRTVIFLIPGSQLHRTTWGATGTGYPGFPGAVSLALSASGTASKLCVE